MVLQVRPQGRKQSTDGVPEPAVRPEAECRWRSRADRKAGSKASTVLQGWSQGRQQSADGAPGSVARPAAKHQWYSRASRKAGRKVPTMPESRSQGRKESIEGAGRADRKVGKEGTDGVREPAARPEGRHRSMSHGVETRKGNLRPRESVNVHFGGNDIEAARSETRAVKRTSSAESGRKRTGT